MTSTPSDPIIPTLPLLAVIGGATLALAMAEPFGSAALPAAGRLLFWGFLIAGNAWKWRLWFRRVPTLLPPSRTVLPILFVGGALFLGLLLPLEFALLAALVGIRVTLPWPLLLAAALLLAAGLAVVIAVVRALARRDSLPQA